MASVPHMCVCVCTYKREEYLAYLLSQLSMVDTGGLFTYSIIVVDNDDSRSAEKVITTLAKSAPIEVQYLVEPRQNISRARNMAVRNGQDRKSTRLNSSHRCSSYAVFCLKKKNTKRL